MTSMHRIQQWLLGHPRLYLLARRWLGVLRFAARRPHDPDFRYFRRLAGSGGLFLDVGANSGASAFSYRMFDRSARILSIEPNPMHRRDLELVRRLIGPDFSFRMVAAGAERGTLSLHVPVHRGVPITGEATVIDEQAGARWTASQFGLAQSEIEVRVLAIPAIPVDELDLSPKAVKIDVEGAELLALRGMTETLMRARPVLLIERGVGVDTLLELLGPLGYAAYAYDAPGDRLEPFADQPGSNVFLLAGEGR